MTAAKAIVIPRKTALIFKILPNSFSSVESLIENKQEDYKINTYFNAGRVTSFKNKKYTGYKK